MSVKKLGKLEKSIVVGLIIVGGLHTIFQDVSSNHAKQAEAIAEAEYNARAEARAKEFNAQQCLSSEARWLEIGESMGANETQSDRDLWLLDTEKWIYACKDAVSNPEFAHQFNHRTADDISHYFEIRDRYNRHYQPTDGRVPSF